MFKATIFYKNNLDILFIRADKENAVVAMERDTYYNKIQEILSDTTTYKKVIKNPVFIIRKKFE